MRQEEPTLLDSIREKAFETNGFDFYAATMAESRLAIESQRRKHKLRQLHISYCRRLRAYAFAQDAESRERAEMTISGLLHG